MVRTSRGTAAAPRRKEVTVEQVCTVLLRPSVELLLGADSA